MLTIEDVKQVSFRRSGIGGYKPEDVDAFIDKVLITMEQLKKEKSELVKKMDILATRVEEYRADEDAVRNALLASQRVADSTIKGAKAKAAQILEEADNASKAKLYDLNIQIKEQKKQHALLMSECNKLREELINICNKHISLAKDLPTKSKVEKVEKQMNEKFPTDNTEEIERAEEIVQVKAPVENPVAIEEPKAAVEPVKPQVEEEQISVEIPPVKEDAEVNTVPDFFSSDVNLIDDFTGEEPKKEAPAPEKKKKSKLFSVLKFGDDYDIEDDDENY